MTSKLARMIPGAWRRLLFALAAVAVLVGPWSWMRAHGSTPATAPQVLLVVTNSQSMGGTTSGAIMSGSGILSSDRTNLQNYSSPANYTIPAGFTPPLNSGSSGSAPYTVSCSAGECDNGPSRMNLAKYAIQQVLTSYGSAVNFGIYTYGTTTPTVYTTYQGYMSPGTRFAYTNTAGSNTQPNPCYNYGSASSRIYSDCSQIDAAFTVNIGSYQYITVASTTDNPTINTVLHANFPYALLMFDSGATYGNGDGGYWYSTAMLGYCSSGTENDSVSSPPYTASDLSNYEIGSIYSCYPNGYASGYPTGTQQYITPSNAGYLPYSPQLLYIQRGFSEIAGTVSATSGNIQVAMGTSPTASAFTTALSPETNSATSSEIKSDAPQSPIGGLLKGALSYLQGLNPATCQGQFVVLLTDGLPTMDLSGNKWPPLGSTAASGYGVTATFNANGTLNTTNDQALTDAVAQVSALASAGIKVYVIGLGAGVSAAVNPSAAASLQAMALAGGTSGFYPANSATDLNSAFLAIVHQIYAASSVSAPVIPISVAGGSSYEYMLTTNPVPLYGAASAYAVSASGTPASSVSWEAGAEMTSSGRANALYSTASDNATVTLLSAIDSAAFSLAATSCVPNVSTIVSYTTNPSFTYGTCSYLGARLSGSFLGGFSQQDSGVFVGPPANSKLVGISSYNTYASGLSGRSKMVLFTNNDGFLYAVDATAGTLDWAWMPRSALSQLQNYSTFQSLDWMDGDFTVVDAQDGSGNWGSYVVGSIRSGAEHFSLKLSTSGVPTKVVYDTVVSGGSSPGDLAPVVGNASATQNTQVAWVGGTAYTLYMVNTGSSTVTSTLYEVNVATGASTSAIVGFQSTSALSYDSQAKQLWLGSSAGGVYQMTVSGNAVTDAATLYKIGTTVNPASTATTYPVLYVGNTRISGVPYVYALDSAQVTVFTVGTSGWTPLWATTTSTGYTYSAGSYSSSSSLNTLNAGAVVSDSPTIISGARIVNGALMVPEYVAATTTCGAGTGYLAFFDVRTGKFPALSISNQGSTVTSNLLVGSGMAFTPSVSVTSTGLEINTGSSANLSPNAPLTVSGAVGSGVAGWRVVN